LQGLFDDRVEFSPVLVKIQEQLPDIVQAVSEKAYFFPAMLLYFYFSLFVSPFSGNIAPCERNCEQSDQFVDPFGEGHSRVFEIETAFLATLKKRFDSPSFFVIFQCSVGIFVGDDN
jgi:hypothetical protein